jgi:O-antigen/teichoic acid export membrane protein
LAEGTIANAPIPASEVRVRFLYFFIPSALQLVLAFVTLPLTTLVLSPADFAAFSLTVSFSALAMSLSQMGSPFVLSQRFRGASEEERCRLVTTMTALVLTSSVVFAAVFIMAFIFLHSYWRSTAGITLAMVALAVVESIGSSVHLLVRGTSRLGSAPGYYSLVTVSKNITAVSVTLAALFLFDLKGIALFIGHGAGGLVALVGSLAMLSRFFKVRVDWDIAKSAMRLGGWNTVSSLSLQARQTIERAVLSRYVGLYDLGLYVHAQQYQSLAMLGCQPIQSAVVPVLLDEAKEKDPQFRRTARASNVLFLGVSIFGVAAALFGRAIIGLLTHDKFNAAGPYVALLVGVVLIQISGQPQLAHCLSNGRARYLCLCNILGVTGAILTLVVLVAQIGLSAAVCASYVQFMLFRVATGINPSSSVRLPFQDGWAIVGVLAIVIALAGVEYFDAGLLARSVIFIAYFAVVLLFGRSTVLNVWLQIRAHIRPHHENVNLAKLGVAGEPVRSDRLA